MTDFLRREPDLAGTSEAARLMQAGRLKEATALIQRSLTGSVSGPAQSGPHAGARANADALHGTILHEKVRILLEQIKRSVAPVLNALTGREPGLQQTARQGGTRQEEPQAEPPLDTPPEPGPGAGGRFIERNFTNAAGTRAYKLYIPKAAGPRPLIVMLHGCTQSPEDFAAGTRMNELAEEEGFYVAYPRQTRDANAQKCWNWFQLQDQERESGEAGIVAGITRAIMADRSIDPARVYIAGLSAGGAAAANLARAYPDLYAAVGIHSGLAAGCARDLPSALMAMKAGAPGLTIPDMAGRFGAGSSLDAVHIPTIVFHGDGDKTVNPLNGEQILVQAGIDRLEAQQSASGNGSGQSYLRTRYTDEAGKVQVESWLVRGGGHAWSGGSSKGSYTDPAGPDASRAMVAFFRRHALTLANQPGSTATLSMSRVPPR